MEVSNCCDALPWHLETYDSLGICSRCKEHAVFEEAGSTPVPATK